MSNHIDKYNKYKPKVGSGGGGRPVTIDSSDGGSSFVNGPVDNRNIL